MNIALPDLTIMIQGRLSRESVDFYIKNYNKYNVVISTWTNNKIDTSNLPENIRLIQNDMPKHHGHQNIYLQIWSTIYGLRVVDAKYCIKMRGDEYVSNIEYIYDCIAKDNDKLYTLPIFFRKWTHIPYHISDHLIAGKTDNLKLMFETALHRKKDHPVAEIIFTRGYLEKKIPDIYKKYEDKKMMQEYFDILNLGNLQPYLLVANCFGKRFRNNFVPSHHASISNIKDI